MKQAIACLFLVSAVGCGNQADDATAIKEREAVQQHFKAVEADRAKAAAEIAALRKQINDQAKVIEALSDQIEAVKQANGKLSSRIAVLVEQLSRRSNESRKETPPIASQEPATESLPSNAVTRDEFTKSIHPSQFESRTPDHVLKLYGKPDATWKTGDTTYWRYDRRTYDAATNKIDNEAVIEFTSDGVNLGAGRINYR
jgi:uncharacterized coiled-coil protein SlyX